MLRKILKVAFVGTAILTSGGSSVATPRARSEDNLGLCTGTFTQGDQSGNYFLYCAVESSGPSLVGSSYNITKKLADKNQLMAKNNDQTSIEICNTFNGMIWRVYEDLFSIIKTIGEKYNCGPVLNPQGGIGIQELPAITTCLQKAADNPLPDSPFNVTNTNVSPQYCLRRG